MRFEHTRDFGLRVIACALVGIALPGTAFAADPDLSVKAAAAPASSTQQITVFPSQKVATYFVFTQSAKYDASALATAFDKLQKAWQGQPGFHASMSLAGLDGFRLVGYVQFSNEAAWNTAQASAAVQNATANFKKVATRYDIYEAPPGGGLDQQLLKQGGSAGAGTTVRDTYRIGDGIFMNEAIALNGHNNSDVGMLMQRHQGSQPNDVHGFRSFIVHGAVDKSRNINVIHYDNLRDTFVASLAFGVQPIINAGGDLTNQNGWNPNGVAQINVWNYEVTAIY